MAITFLGADSAAKAAGSSTAMNVTLPSHQADDFAIIVAGYRTAGGLSQTMAIGTASGWSELRNDSVTTGDDRRTYIFYKKLTSGSETSPTVTISATGGNRACVLLVYRGVDTTTAFDVTETFGSGPNDSTPTPPAITPTSNNGAFLTMMCNTQDEITAAGAPATPSGTAVGGSAIGLDGNFELVAAHLLDYGTAATITPTAFTNSTSGTAGEYNCYSIALRAAAAAAAHQSQLLTLGVS